MEDAGEPEEASLTRRRINQLAEHVEVVLCGGGHGNLHRTQLLLAAVLDRPVVQRLLDEAVRLGQFLKTMFKTFCNALYRAMRDALRARCDVCVLCVPVNCGLSLLAGGELALKQNSSPDSREPFPPHYGGCCI
jgi:hypothetical protein